VWTGGQYVVVWRGDFVIVNCTATCYPPPPSYAFVARLTADGTPLDQQPTLLITPGTDAVWGAHIATNGADVAVTIDFNDRVDFFLIQPDLKFTRRTLFQWAFVIGFGVSPSPSEIAFDGSYVAAWRPRDGVRSWLNTARVPGNGNETLERRSVPI